MSEEELRELLLAEVYAGAFSGLGASFWTRTGFGTPGRRSWRSLHGIHKGDMVTNGRGGKVEREYTAYF